MTMHSVLFRVDAGRAHGLGHLQRCTSLALAVRRFGLEPLLAVTGEPDIQARIKAAGLAQVLCNTELGNSDDLARVGVVAAQLQAVAIVIDSYRNTTDYMLRLREGGRLVVAIDDLAAVPFSCHLVVNGAAHAKDLPYRGARPDVEFLLGPEYALLRPEFWEGTPADARRDRTRILMAVGGGDPLNFIPQIIDALAPLPADLSLDVIVGPLAANRPEIDRASVRSRREVELHFAPTAVRKLMERATLAVSAAGQTLYELACVGCPTIALETADNQRGQFDALAAAGVIDPIRDARPPAALPIIVERIRRLLDDPDRRRAMGEAGRRLVDGRGAVRVAGTVAARVGARAASSQV